MPKTIDLTAVGECLIELTESTSGLYRASYAGDVLNTLFYASRLGLRTALLSAIGEDSFTEGLAELLDRESINRSLVPKLNDHPNGLYAIQADRSGSPNYNFWRSESAARETLRVVPFEALERAAIGSKHLHISAIALAVMHDRERLVELARIIQGKTSLSLDANVRHTLWKDIGELEQLIAQFAPFVDVLFVTDTDDAAVYGERTSMDALDCYHDLGYEAVVYRQGAKGCIASCGDAQWVIPALIVHKVIDTTGAGDAFNAGFIRAYLKGQPIEECAMEGNAIASCVLGGQGGLKLSFDEAEGMQAIKALRIQMSRA